MINKEYSLILDHNVFIVWKPEYNLGIPIIDEQHRGIVTIINSLSFGMQYDRIKTTLKPTVDMMESYAQIHFQTEEIFLELMDYPLIEEHKQSHQELTSKLNSVGISSLLNRDPYQLMDFLKKWWIDHICTKDFEYRNYLHSE